MSERSDLIGVIGDLADEFTAALSAAMPASVNLGSIHPGKLEVYYSANDGTWKWAWETMPEE